MNRKLTELYALFVLNEIKEKLQHFVNIERINWEFIPRGHRTLATYGRLEAAVKSFKHHFLRIVGNTLLTLEQLETLIIEIEVILHSRPISPMSPDPNDFLPLTPAHFLIGGSLISFPQLSVNNISSQRLSVWQHAQQLRQHFWKRWHAEYLHHLSTRTNQHIQIGTLVIIGGRQCFTITLNT